MKLHNMTIKIIITVLCLFIFAIPIYAVDDKSTQSQESSSITEKSEWMPATDYFAVKINKNLVINDKRIVSVGDKGTIRISDDNKQWSTLTPVTNENLNDLLNYKGNELIAFGDHGQIIISTDGSVWTKIASGSNSDITASASNGSQIAAFTRQGKQVLYSTDGRDWKTIDIKNQYPINRLLWTGSMFIGVGDNGTVCTSKDGMNWNCSSVNKNDLYDVVWNGSVFAAFGNNVICTSKDGMKWETKELSSNKSDAYKLKKGIWNGKQFTAFGTAELKGQKKASFVTFTSVNGSNWNMGLWDTYSNDGLHEAYDLFWDGKGFEALGFGLYKDTAYRIMLYSGDGIKWSSRSSIITSKGSSFRSILKYGKAFLAIDWSGFSYSSTDAVKWSFAGTMPVIKDLWWPLEIMNDGKKFIIPGGMDSNNRTSSIYTSIDGMNWTKATGTYYCTSQNCEMLKYDGKTYYCNDSSSIYTSTDLKKWNSIKVGQSYYISNVIINGSNIIAFGKEIYRSTDGGKSWKSVSTKNSCFHTLYGNNLYLSLAINKNGYFVASRSKNGEQWTDAMVDNASTPVTIRAAAFGKDIFVLVGGYGNIYTSADGAKWRKVKAPTDKMLYSVRYINNEFYAVGENGTILHSKDAANWEMEKSPVSTRLYDIAANKTRAIIIGDGNTYLIKDLDSNRNPER